MDQAASYYHSERLEIVHLKNRPMQYQEHNHVSVYTIGLVLRGKIALEVQEHLTHSKHFETYSSESFFIVAPYQLHALFLPDTYEMLSICVNKDLVQGLAIAPDSAPANLYGVLSQKLFQLCFNVEDMVLRKAVEALYSCQVPQTPDAVIFSSAQALRWAPENYNRLQVMADETGYNLHYYIKKFKKYIGVTPYRFQLQSKIRKAQGMIARGKPFTNMALNLGFYDQSHFIKCFKKVVGFTPSEYRQCVKRLPE